MPELISQLSIKTDGGSRGNPGSAAWAFVVYDAHTQAVIAEDKLCIGIATNNEAEYQAFLASTKWVVAQCEQPTEAKPTHINWQLDSKLVVEQLNKKWKIKEPRMAEYAAQIWKLLVKAGITYTITHIPREQNKDADALVNQALDQAAA
jgi:ribonuclease HI